MTRKRGDAKGMVYLVGAGPGDPGLLTCRGRDVLAKADVLVYDGLAPIEHLALVPADCEQIYAGKKHSPHGAPYSQAAINELLVERARAGQCVVRLKGGDPFVFGRGAEECMALAAEGLAFEVVPGVSAATAVPAYAGIPLTVRGVAASAVLVTGHEAANKSDGGIDWQAVAGHQSIVLFMAWKQIATCVENLRAAGKSENTPAAAIRWGTRAGQKTVLGTLGELPALMAKPDMRPPILVVVGEVVRSSARLGWFEKRPLFGNRILLTREPERASSAASALRELGADVLVAPTTKIVMAADSALETLGASLVSGSWDWLLLSSANAAYACKRALQLAAADSRALRPGRIAAVGQATVLALSEMGIVPDLVPEKGSGQSLAAAVIAEASEPSKVLYPRALGGRDEPVELLRDAGHEVELVHAYESAAREASEPALVDALAKLRSGAIHCIAFFAPSQLAALFALDAEVPELLAKVPVLAAIGKTTAAALRARGLEVHAVAARPTSQALAEAITAALLPDADA